MTKPSVKKFVLTRVFLRVMDWSERRIARLADKPGGPGTDSPQFRDFQESMNAVRYSATGKKKYAPPPAVEAPADERPV